MSNYSQALLYSKCGNTLISPGVLDVIITHRAVGCQQQQRLQQRPSLAVGLRPFPPLEEAHHLVSSLLWIHTGEDTLSVK